MRFERFQVYEVVVPARSDIVADAFLKTGGEAPPSWPQVPIYLVQGETSDGVSAVGESARGDSEESVIKTLRELLSRDLSSFAPASAWGAAHLANGLPTPSILPSWSNADGRSYALLESLWFDAVGKAAGVPACQLLGGAVRDRVEVDFWANKPDTKALASLVKEACELGLRGIKLKSDAVGGTALAVAEVAADAPKGFHFTIDPMCSWRTFRESRHLFERLVKTGFDIRIEDPFSHDSISEWRRARAAFPEITFAWHARDEATLRTIVLEDVADVVNLAMSGVCHFMSSAPMVEFSGRDFWEGTSLELGVQQHLRLHAAAAARRCVLPCDLQGAWVRSHSLVSAPMAYQNGCALVPTTPGIGVELDRSALDSFLVREFEIR